MSKARKKNSPKPTGAEGKIFGRNACAELFRRRKADIVRVYVTAQHLKTFGALLKYCAENRRAYHIVSAAELSKVSGSLHHEGICIISKRLLPKPFELFRKERKGVTGPTCLLYLDGVANPHNIGSILRTAAHFGVQGILGETAKLPGVSAALARVAEGGAELVPMVACENPLNDLRALQKDGLAIVGTTVKAKASLHQQKLPHRVVFILGAEGEGMSGQLEKLCDLLLTIPGSGAVESLNVSAACAVMLGEYYRQVHHD